MAVGSNPTAWRDHLKELIQPTYGNMVYEFLKQEHSEDYEDAVTDPFEPADRENLTRMEEIQFEHLLRDQSKKQDRIDEYNRLNVDKRNKIKGIILTTVDKELQKKCFARSADYETELDLFNFVEFIIKEASQQTAEVDVDVLCAKISTEIYWLKQSGDQSLFDYKEQTEHVIDKNNNAVAKHADDELLSLALITAKRAAKIFISGLRPDIYGDLIDDLKTGVAMKTTSYPVGIDKAYDMVTDWAQARGVNVSKKGGKIHQSVLDDSSEINMATTIKTATVKTTRGQQGKENTAPASANKDKEVKHDCPFCKGVQHRLSVCPKAKLIKELEKMGVSSVDQIQIKPKVEDKQPTVNMYTLANSDDESDEYEIAFMTVSNSDSDVSLLNLTDKSNDDKSEYALDKQSFFTAPVESNEVTHA
jgi:hypothetical protein